MKKILILMMMLVAAIGAVMPVEAWNADKACDNAGTTDDVRSAAGCDDRNATNKKTLRIARGIVIFVSGFVAVIAVITIVISAIQMTVSQGDPGKVAKARNGILYSVIGLVVALLAFLIVNFVITQAL